MSDEQEQAEKEEAEERQAPPARVLYAALVVSGEEELDRPARSLFWSGLAAGVAIHASLIVMGALHGALPDAPWRSLVVDAGYVFGFLVVILGRLQLFTESTITAVLPLMAEPSRQGAWRTLRLWAIVLVANLLGTFAVAALSARGGLATAEQVSAMVAVATPVLETGVWTNFLHAIPAGFFIAAIPWVLPSVRENAVLVVAALTYVIAVGGFGHVVVGSDETFLLLLTGNATAGQVAGYLVPTLLGNIVGGSCLFAVLAHAQVEAET